MAGETGLKTLLVGSICMALLLGACGRRGALDIPANAPAADVAQAEAGIPLTDDPGSDTGVAPIAQTEPGGFVLDPLIR
ncbi:MAG: hypothetical protein JJ902_17845 [Roseibium sp.]|nr:hypothetical protein [Roseibium sp.]